MTISPDRRPPAPEIDYDLLRTELVKAMDNHIAAVRQNGIPIADPIVDMKGSEDEFMSFKVIDPNDPELQKKISITADQGEGNAYGISGVAYKDYPREGCIVRRYEYYDKGTMYRSILPQEHLRVLLGNTHDELYSCTERDLIREKIMQPQREVI